MKKTIPLGGIWQFLLDNEKKGLACHYENLPFSDTITLPGTVSLAQKGEKSSARHTGYLTDPYACEGYAWYRKQIILPFSHIKELADWRITLTMERTRISRVFVDGQDAGSFDSLIAPHVYDLTPYLHTLTPTLTVMVANTGYKIPGGHLTSPDTQTNWNGILGNICLTCEHRAALSAVSIKRGRTTANHSAAVDVSILNLTKETGTYTLSLCAEACRLNADTAIFDTNPAEGADNDALLMRLADFSGIRASVSYPVSVGEGTTVHTVLCPLAADEEDVLFWSEYEPNLYRITVTLTDENGGLLDEKTIWHGERTFAADSSRFLINGQPTFLRGKHEGMIFPMTGFAPMSVTGWLSVMKTAKEFGINHYRFHTCCPPDAAFLAADLLGIYLEPELPFWGTFHAPEDDGYDKTAQDFLRDEGERMLKTFSSHASFCMMSMGNELWGSPSAINELVSALKADYPDILYTQGSNNFQWSPNIQPSDDFFCGVRFSLERQIRGSYAMCDKPLGHIQTAEPNTRHTYEAAIRPASCMEQKTRHPDDTVEIQYGTGVRRVRLTEEEAELAASVPVVSHEIGQYCMYPDFKEISRYTGVLKAENFAIFRERLKEKRLGALADAYFKSSGAFAAACYKEELETAFRTPSLAGFQLLDLQDFSGQGTAIVGMLNAFMENKGLISADTWRQFCSDAVLLAEFDSYLVTAGEPFPFSVSLAWFRREALAHPTLTVRLADAADGRTVFSKEYAVCDIPAAGRHALGSFTLDIPAAQDGAPREYLLTVALSGAGIQNQYTLWSYRPACDISKENGSGSAAVAHSAADALALAKEREHVLLFLPEEENTSSVIGTYCTDFWCYPMFRSISESMGKEVPVGTLGLLIDNTHPALAAFPCRTYSTPQWYHTVNASRSTILDETDILPIVMTVDNFERNHRLGLLYEVHLSDLESDVLVCTADLPRLIREGHAEAAQLYRSLLTYVLGNAASDRPTAPQPMTSDAFAGLFRAD